MMVFIATVFLVLLAIQKGTCDEICYTKECKETAARVLESLNHTVQPCDDFFEFACGGWISKHPIPQYKAWWNTLSLIQEDVDKRLHDILEAPNKKEDGKPIKLARAFYWTCMNEESANNQRMKSLLNMIEKIGLRRRPPSDEEAEHLDIPNIIGRAQRYMEVDILIRAYIERNPRDNTQNQLMLAQASPTMKPLEYKKIVKNIMKVVEKGEKVDRYTNELTDFVSKLFKILATPKMQASPSYWVYTMIISKLQHSTDPNATTWNWTRYLMGVFEETDITVNPNVDKAVVMDKNYFETLMSLLSKTSLGTIARFVWFHLFLSAPPFTNDKFRHLYFLHGNVVNNLNSKSIQRTMCTTLANSYFGMALTAAYVKQHFTAEQKQKAMEMWTDVSASFDEILTELNWMDSRTKEQAHRKLARMRPLIGFPDWVANPKKLENYYRGIKIFEGSLFDTCMQFILVVGRQTLNSWKEKPKMNKWITPGTTVNAFYSPTLNSITIPAVILHVPLYGNGVEALNYGAIGAILGHELTHGFDNSGRRFDAHGNMREWWSKGTLHHFYNKVNCMIKQYGRFEVTQLGEHYKLNGIKTQGENMADNGGIREAFRAYQKLKARSQPQQGLPGLEKYSGEQYFFLGFAQLWCGSATSRSLKQSIKENVHAPNRFRVLGTLQNNADFAKAWNCPRGSPMNPTHKCIVW